MCCFEIETGGLAIGWFNLVYSLVAMLANVMCLAGRSNWFGFNYTVTVVYLIVNIVMLFATFFLIRGVEKVSSLKTMKNC